MNLLTESLWGDEAFSALAVQLPFREMIGVVMRDTAPPLFYLLGFIWGRLFGFSEVSLRSLTMILVALTGVFAGLTVWELSKSRFNALGAGVLTTFAPFLFVFAFEWRMYALLAMTIAASTYCFLTKRWGWYVVATLAALYTHHFAVFTVLAQGIWFLLREFKWRGGLWEVRRLWPFGAIALGYAFWLYPMYYQIMRVRGGGFWLTAPKISEVFGLTAKLAIGGVESSWRLLAVILAVGLLVAKDWKRWGREVAGVLFIALTPVVLAAAVSYLVTPIFYDRYLLSVVPGVAIVLALGTRREANTGLLVLGLLYLSLSWNRFGQPIKRPFREMAAELKSELKEGDVLVNYNGRAHHLWESKYYGIPAPIYAPNGPLPLYVGTAQMSPEDTIEKLPRVERRLVLVGSEKIETVELPGLVRVLAKNFGELNYSFWIPK